MQFAFVTDANPFFVAPTAGETSAFVNYNFIDDYGPQIRRGNVSSLSSNLGLRAKVLNDWSVVVEGSYNLQTTRIVQMLSTPRGCRKRWASTIQRLRSIPP